MSRHSVFVDTPSHVGEEQSTTIVDNYSNIVAPTMDDSSNYVQ